jgi:hypothetical protein
LFNYLPKTSVAFVQAASTAGIIVRHAAPPITAERIPKRGSAALLRRRSPGARPGLPCAQRLERGNRPSRPGTSLPAVQPPPALFENDPVKKAVAEHQQDAGNDDRRDGFRGIVALHDALFGFSCDHDITLKNGRTAQRGHVNEPVD